MKKIVIAPDSFKGTMTSIEVCEIIEKSIHRVFPNTETVKIPIADGGEGTVDAYLYAVGGVKKYVTVHDPFMREIEAYYGILADSETAVIEMAQASGLLLVEKERDPIRATSFGTGELIRSALDEGCKKIILGIGGSATNDGGIGAFSALGVDFLDNNGKKVNPNGGGLEDLWCIDAEYLDKRLLDIEILVACDVDNPLCGPNGASNVYGPQKGATFKQIEKLDQNLARYAELLFLNTGRDNASVPGTGAAGGIGISLLAFTKARLMSGIDIVLDTVGFDRLVQGADFVFTGEGKMDGQSLNGKVPIGIAKRSKQYAIPVYAVVGLVGDGIEKVYDAGIDAVFQTTKDSVPFEIVRETCRADLAFLIESLMRFKKREV
jgi:glycerate kinase